MKQLKNVRTLVTISMLTAISVLLFLFIRFPIFPSAPFLIYEPADVPIILVAFLFGPLPALVMTAAVSILQALLASSDGWIGAVMHFIATGALTAIAGTVYKRDPSTKNAILGLVIGSLAMALTMIPLNLMLTPLYGVPVQVVKDIMVPAIIPFNLIKAGANSVLGLSIYKALTPVVKKYEIGV